MSSPSIGRIVHYFPGPEEVVNDRGIMPAMITAVHNENCVNLKIFVDGQGQELWRSSVVQKAPGYDTRCWDWPTRTD